MKDVIVCGADDSAFRVRLPRESDLTLSRAINAEHAAEETWKHAHEVLQFQWTTDLQKTNHPYENQNK